MCYTNLFVLGFYSVENLYYLLIGVHLLTYWSFLVGEKCGAVAAIHVSHAYTVTVSPVKLPVMGVWILWNMERGKKSTVLNKDKVDQRLRLNLKGIKKNNLEVNNKRKTFQSLSE